MECILFPDLTNTEWRYIDLASEASSEFDSSSDNPLRRPSFQTDWLNKLVGTSTGKDIRTYGGWLEQRFDLWKGIEPLALESKMMLHVAVDINNLSPGTRVHAPADCTIYHVMGDDTERNGWGGRLILQLSTPFQEEGEFLLFGHLDPSSLGQIGNTLKKGDCLGIVAEETRNGGWFPHIHVQLMKKRFIEEFSDRLDEIDGYLLSQTDADRVDELCMDPTFLVFEKKSSVEINTDH